MKKLFVALISAVLCLTSLCLTGCHDEKQTVGDLDNLADCELGYQLAVYPQCEFNYAVATDLTIHITSFTATLTEKNEIHQGDTISTEFYPYAITVSATGTTDAFHEGQVVYFRFKYSESARSSMKASVDANGNISWSVTVTSYSNFIISFLSITLG